MARSASFVRFERGLLHGSFGFRLVAGYPEPATRNLFSSLDGFREKYPWAEKILCIQGDTSGIEEVVAVAKERGWMVACEIPGTSRPAWLDKIDYRIVVVDNDGWIGFKFQELLYQPDSSTPLIEPKIPKDLAGFLYISGEHHPLTEIFEFFQNSSKTWRLHVPATDRFEMALDIG